MCRKPFVGCSSIAVLLPVYLWLISSSEILCKYYRKLKEARPWYMSPFLSVSLGASLSVNMCAWHERFDCICSHLYGCSNISFLCYNWFDVIWKKSFPPLTWKFNICLIWSRKNMQFYINKKNPWISLHATICYFSL